jgi:hypothetical protein
MAGLVCASIMLKKNKQEVKKEILFIVNSLWLNVILF